jgi:tRNA(Ile)-lysidine synthase
MHRAATDAPADLRLDLAGFLKVPETLQSAILVRAFDTVSRRVGHAYPALVESRLREITRRLGDGRIGREDDIELGAGWRVEVRDGELRVTYGVAPQEQEQQERSAPRPLPVTLPIPGEVRWGEWTVRVEVNVSAPDLPTTDPWSEIIDLDALAGRPIVVRGRQSGDRVHPLGASGSKPLKEFFRECSVLPENRDHAALVATCDTPSEIIWVPGKRLAHPFRVTENTTRRGRMVCRPPTDVPTE